MNDQPNTPSGSRWEPDPDAETTAAKRRDQPRGRAILAGAATALTLGGGLTGFVIGHATAGDEANGLRPATSFPRDGSNQGPGGRQYGGRGEGQQGPPSFQGGDGNGDGFGPPQGLDGSSSSNGSTGSGTGSTGTGT